MMKLLAVGEACMAIFWPTPGFMGRTFDSYGDLNFCISCIPLWERWEVEIDRKSRGTCWLRSWYIVLLIEPVSFFNPFQTGSRMHCLWIGSLVGFKAVGSDLPQGPAYHAGGFPHISCSTSPYVEEHMEPSLFSRRLKPSLNCVMKIQLTILFIFFTRKYETSS